MFFSRKDFCQSCLKNKGRQVLINWKKKSKCHLLNQLLRIRIHFFYMIGYGEDLTALLVLIRTKKCDRDDRVLGTYVK